MRGGSGILARNNFAGRANPSRIFAGQTRGGPMRGGLARFAIPTRKSPIIFLLLKIKNIRSTKYLLFNEKYKVSRKLFFKIFSFQRK